MPPLGADPSARAPPQPPAGGGDERGALHLPLKPWVATRVPTTSSMVKVTTAMPAAISTTVVGMVVTGRGSGGRPAYTLGSSPPPASATACWRPRRRHHHTAATASATTRATEAISSGVPARFSSAR